MHRGIWRNTRPVWFWLSREGAIRAITKIKTFQVIVLYSSVLFMIPWLNICIIFSLLKSYFLLQLFLISSVGALISVNLYCIYLLPTPHTLLMTGVSVVPKDTSTYDLPRMMGIEPPIKRSVVAFWFPLVTTVPLEPCAMMCVLGGEQYVYL